MNVQDVPDDAVLFGAKYTPQTVLSVTNSYIAVRVSQIANPGAFWMQFDEMNGELENLMNALQ